MIIRSQLNLIKFQVTLNTGQVDSRIRKLETMIGRPGSP